MDQQPHENLFEQMLSQNNKDLKMLLSVKKDDRTPEWEEAVQAVKKSIEQLLYRYVVNGCTDTGSIKGCFPELESEYDPESEELLDLKIMVLGEIARLGPGSDYKNIDGFEEILENKAQEGTKYITFD